MGNDGGSIPTRRELVKEAARNPTTAELKELQQEQQEYQWSYDPISREPLSQPLVSDSTGRLYNKDTILEYLVNSGRPEDVEKLVEGRIKSLKDIVEVKFQVDHDGTADVPGAGRNQLWRCPVTGDKLGPGSKAVYIVPCGHAFSGTAIKEVSGEKCLTCEAEYAPNDVIPILPTTATEIARLSLRIKKLEEKGLGHSLKKAASGGKKRKKKCDVAEPGTSAENQSAKTFTGGKPETDHSGINNMSTASLTARVIEEQERAKRRKLEDKNVRSLFSSRDQSKPIGKSSDFLSRGYSVKFTSRESEISSRGCMIRSNQRKKPRKPNAVAHTSLLGPSDRMTVPRGIQQRNSLRCGAGLSNLEMPVHLSVPANRHADCCNPAETMLGGLKANAEQL
nr:replication termination factor 2 [Quercus suber]